MARTAHTENVLAIIHVAEQFVNRITPRLHTTALLPAEALRKVREAYPGPVVEALAAQFALSQPQRTREANPAAGRRHLTVVPTGSDSVSA